MSDASALNSARITRLRLEAGLSQHAVARALGISQTTIRLLEDGANHDVLTLRFVRRLADVLNTTSAALLDVPDTTKPPAADTGDAVRVQAALAHVEVAVDASCVAEAFCWDLPRAQRALQTLKASLEGSGQRLHRNVNGWRLRACEDLIADCEVERLARCRAARNGMRRDEARLLKLAMEGKLDQAWEAKSARESDRIRLASLLREGLLTRHKGRFSPTPEVVESLDLKATTKLGLSVASRQPFGGSTAGGAFTGRPAARCLSTVAVDQSFGEFSFRFAPTGTFFGACGGQRRVAETGSRTHTPGSVLSASVVKARGSTTSWLSRIRCSVHFGPGTMSGSESCVTPTGRVGRASFKSSTMRCGRPTPCPSAHGAEAAAPARDADANRTPTVVFVEGTTAAAAASAAIRADAKRRRHHRRGFTAVASRRERHSASTPTTREGSWETRLHDDHRRSRDPLYR